MKQALKPLLSFIAIVVLGVGILLYTQQNQVQTNNSVPAQSDGFSDLK